MTAKESVRWFAALIAGVLSIWLIVEPVEFLLVTWLDGEVTTDPETCFAIRNQADGLSDLMESR